MGRVVSIGVRESAIALPGGFTVCLVIVRRPLALELGNNFRLGERGDSNSVVRPVGFCQFDHATMHNVPGQSILESGVADHQRRRI